MGLREEPMIWYRSGMRPASARRNSPGRSLRRARSPVAPNTTMTWLPGRGGVPLARPARDAGVTSARFRAGEGPLMVPAVAAMAVVDTAVAPFWVVAGETLGSLVISRS